MDELWLLDQEKADRIGAAADRVATGELDDQFPIDVFQTGSGTSSNMNANEVIAALAGEDIHPNDDVNMGQSSNDVFPSAVHLAALDHLTNDLIPALEQLGNSLGLKSQEFDDIVKSGRTHLMDAVPITLGQEFSGYAAQVRQGAARVRDTLERVGQIPLGGTAVGTGLNTHPEFAERVRRLLTEETGLQIHPPADPFESQAARDALVEASGALKTVAVSLTKIANDLRFMGSGPRAGLSELFLPELQKGSSIMPGKVNPVIPEVVTQVGAQVIGNDAAITVGGMNGHFELNVFVPLMARNLLQSITLLTSAARLLVAMDDHQNLVRGRDPAQRRHRGLGGRDIARHQVTDHVHPAVPSPIRQRSAESGGDHLLGRALRVAVRLRTVHDAAADVLRCPYRPLPGSAGALLAIRLLSAAADLAPALGGMCALARGRQLGHDHLVDQGDIGGHVEQLRWQFGAAGFGAAGVHDIDRPVGTGGRKAHAASPFLTALRTTTRPPLLPGIAPLISNRPRSVSTACTVRF